VVRALGIWMNDAYVGRWRTTRDGVHELAYERSWVESELGRPLSLSLPITANRTLRGSHVESWFDNLLPDSENLRQRLRARFHARSGGAMDLLAEVGRDCVGAVQLLPEGKTPAQWTEAGTRLSDDDIAHRLAGLTSPHGFGGVFDADEFRLSIAGAHEKTAFTCDEAGAWHAPIGPTPTTHIFKLQLGVIGQYQIDMRHSVENEWACGQILRALGFDVASASVATFGSFKVLVVERFDRMRSKASNRWLRLPQEDLCQATATPATRKYETDGGPGIARCAELLAQSTERDIAVRRFLSAQFVFWLLAAIDGHAKNFSVRILAGGRYTMTPLYDVLSAWPVIGTKARTLPYQKARLAMAVHGKNAHRELGIIQARHWRAESERAGHPDIFHALVSIAERVPSALAEVESTLPTSFPTQVWEAIAGGAIRHASRFLQQAGG